MSMSRRALLASALLATGGAASPSRAAVVMLKRLDGVTTLDPHRASDRFACEIISNIYDTLVRCDPRGGYCLSAASAVFHNAARTEWAFTFGGGLAFRPGRPLTPDAACWSLRRCLTTGEAPASLLHRLGWTARNAEQAVRVEGPCLVLGIAAGTPEDLLFGCLASSACSIVDPMEAGTPDWWRTRHAAGSGDYAMGDAWCPAGTRLLARTGGLDIEIRGEPDPYAQLAAVRCGSGDIALDPMPAELRAARADPDLRVVADRTASVIYLAMNTAVPVLSDSRVREAIRWAIDYEGLERSFLKGRAYVHQGFLPRGFPGALDEVRYTYQPGRAREMLQAAGATDLELVLTHGSRLPRIDLADRFRHDLSLAGIRIALEGRGPGEVLERVWTRRYELALCHAGADFHDPGSLADTFCVNDDPGPQSAHRTCAWTTGWSDASLAAAAAAARTAGDYGRLQLALQKDGPFAFMFGEIDALVTRKEIVGATIPFVPGQRRFKAIGRKADRMAT